MIIQRRINLWHCTLWAVKSSLKRLSVKNKIFFRHCTKIQIYARKVICQTTLYCSIKFYISLFEPFLSRRARKASAPKLALPSFFLQVRAYNLREEFYRGEITAGFKPIVSSFLIELFSSFDRCGTHPGYLRQFRQTRYTASPSDV